MGMDLERRWKLAGCGFSDVGSRVVNVCLTRGIPVEGSKRDFGGGWTRSGKGKAGSRLDLGWNAQIWTDLAMIRCWEVDPRVGNWWQQIGSGEEYIRAGVPQILVVLQLLEDESINWSEVEGSPGIILIPLDEIDPSMLSFEIDS
ncbi:hypothetical protein KSP39_PZI014622 [Platanthera zijinensis]|uniref:Uncharacterized protein n=1 Tax=Platanthera zijinensis TaxID=2320716 RepID=A0AAP0G2E0_9ASPA